MKKTLIWAAMLLTCVQLNAQTTLTLEDCRDMAVQNSKELDQAKIDREMAGYDRKIALANYFPNISATGAYVYNNRDISLISDSQSNQLCNAGTLLQEQLDEAIKNMGGSKWQTVIQLLQRVDPTILDGLVPNIADPINAIGADIDKTMHPDFHNVWAGAITVEQPLFAGGKIIYSNQMAALAENLADAKYDLKYADVLLDVDQAYWQIVSIAAKKKLAQSYSELLHLMQADVQHAIQAGVATESDALQIQVKTNEADMLYTKSSNGLELAKMLLCKRIGLPLDTEIVLADEDLEVIPVPVLGAEKSLDDIYAARPETRSLSLAKEIYDRKAKVVRADMLPTVALVGNYLISNPNAFNGIQNNWQGGMFSVGVMLRVPICHGGENLYKYRKAKAEARQYTDKYDDATGLINLQVARERKLCGEAMEKLTMAESNLASAEENLRKASVGYEAGVIETNTVLGAQTAWLSAHSEYIDAGIELQMAAASLRKAEGSYKADNK